MRPCIVPMQYAHFALYNRYIFIPMYAMDNINTAQHRQKRDFRKRHRTKDSFGVGGEVLQWTLRRADRKGKVTSTLTAIYSSVLT